VSSGGGDGSDNDNVVQFPTGELPPATTTTGTDPHVFMVTDQAVPLRGADVLHILMNWLIGYRVFHIRGHWSFAMKPLRADLWMGKR